MKTRDEKQRERSRNVFFTIGYSNQWHKPVHVILKELRDKYELNWLRISMSYHRFPNMRERIQGVLSKKLTKGINSLDFMTRDCNCNTKECNYGNHCRKKIVIYEAKCKVTNKVYVGNTQQNFKDRMGQHFGDVKRLVQTGKKSDSYAKHFGKVWNAFSDSISPKLQRSQLEYRILWQGNPISAVKSFGKDHCALCSKERYYIMEHFKRNPNKLINSCSEIYGACRHKPRFHRFKEETTTDVDSTDERRKREKVKRMQLSNKRRRINKNTPESPRVSDGEGVERLPSLSGREVLESFVI